MDTQTNRVSIHFSYMTIISNDRIGGHYLDVKRLNYLQNILQNVLTFPLVWGIINTVKGEGCKTTAQASKHKRPPCKARKNFSKIFEKPLDKSNNIWDNNSTNTRQPTSTTGENEETQ